MHATFDDTRIERLQQVLQRHVDEGRVPGLTWGLARAGDVRTGALGRRSLDGAATQADDVFRIASVTKVVVATLALQLVEDGLLRLDEPVERHLPELADRRVLVDPAGPLEDTVPASRPMTTRDVLTFRSGWGMDFTAFGVREQPVVDAMERLDVSNGPPRPQRLPALDEWLRRMGTLPLSHQPGERWLYDTSADVLAALVARAAGAPLPQVLAERVCGPLGMVDTGFSVPPAGIDRLGPCYIGGVSTPERTVYDPVDGQWSTPPAFASGGAGLVSTTPDLLALGDGLLRHRVLSRAMATLMATDQLTAEQRTTCGPAADGSLGWGLGTAVVVERRDVRSRGTFGWDGGLGSSFWVDPAEDLVGVLLTNQAWDSPAPPGVVVDFWSAAYAALAG